MADIIHDPHEHLSKAILDALREFKEKGEGVFLTSYPPYKIHFGIRNDLRFPPRAISAAAYFKIRGRIPGPEEVPRKVY